MSTLKNQIARAVPVAAMFAIAGCATPGTNVRVDQAESGPPACHSFQWWSPSKDATSFTEQRVRDAVLAELKDKGYAISPEDADCRVSYLFSASERPKSKPSVGVGAGGGSGGIGGGIGVSIPVGRRNEFSGTFTIDVIDAARNAQVWSGSIDGAFKGAELTEDEAKEAARTVLEEFPNASGQ